MAEAPLKHHRSPDGSTWGERGRHRQATLGRRIESNMRDWGERRLEFLSPSRPSRTTLGAVWERGKRLSSALAAAGIRSGDRVAVQLPSWEECVALYLACFHSNITIVPIVTIFGIREVSYILRDSQARTLVCPSQYRGVRDYSHRAQELYDAGLLDKVIVLDGENLPDYAESWETFEARASAEADPGPNDADAVALILYTSGTTSNPKGARHTHNTFGAEFESTAYERLPDARALCLYPAGHTAGTLNLFRCFFVPEANFVLAEWDARLAVDTIEREKITRISVTPFYLTEMLDVAEREDRDLSCIRQLGIGGTTVDSALVERGMRRGITITRSFGSTEHPTISGANPDDTPERRIASDGRIIDGNSVRLVNEEGQDVAPGEEGEILSTGPELFVGYTDERLNQHSFVEGIWFRTGDVGRMDRDGYLTITDRKKDIVIRGGENISAREVEEVLRKHEAVADAAVVPFPDPRLGERVCAFVVLNDGASFTLSDALAHFVAQGHAKQKTPERLEFIDVLPRTAIGKVNKSALKALLQTQRERTA